MQRIHYHNNQSTEVNTVSPVTPLLHPIPTSPTHTQVTTLTSRYIRYKTYLPRYPACTITQHRNRSPHNHVHFTHTLTSNQPTSTTLLTRLSSYLTYKTYRHIYPTNIHCNRLLSTAHTLPRIHTNSNLLQHTLQTLTAQPHIVTTLLQLKQLTTQLNLATPLTQLSPHLNTLLRITSSLPNTSLTHIHHTPKPRHTSLILLTNYINDTIRHSALHSTRIILRQLNTHITILSSKDYYNTLTQRTNSTTTTSKLTRRTHRGVTTANTTHAITFTDNYRTS